MEQSDMTFYLANDLLNFWHTIEHGTPHDLEVATWNLRCDVAFRAAKGIPSIFD
jgi:hypothetical protein